MQQQKANTVHTTPTHEPIICHGIFTANTIVFQQRSKWPLPLLHFDKEQGNLTQRGYPDRGKAGSAAGEGDGADAEDGTRAERAKEAVLAEPAARTA